jgi:hypothetical protein
MSSRISHHVSEQGEVDRRVREDEMKKCRIDRTMTV